MNGIPLDVAETMDPLERAARLIIIGQYNGGEFDFRKMEWKERR